MRVHRRFFIIEIFPLDKACQKTSLIKKWIFHAGLDIEIQIFLWILSALATFEINNNNSRRRIKGGGGCVSRLRQVLKPDTNYSSFLCHFNIATRHLMSPCSTTPPRPPPNNVVFSVCIFLARNEIFLRTH